MNYIKTFASSWQTHIPHCVEKDIQVLYQHRPMVHAMLRVPHMLFLIC